MRVDAPPGGPNRLGGTDRIPLSLSTVTQSPQPCRHSPQRLAGPGVKTGGANSFFPISLPVGAGIDNCCDLSMKFQPVIAIFAALVATSFAMDQPSFHTKGAPTGKPTGPLKPGEY